MDKVNIGGILFNNVNMLEALQIIEERISEKNKNKTSFLFVANQDIINKTKKTPGLSIDNLNKAFLTIPDGHSIIVASKILGVPLKERVTGPDLMEKFIEISAKKGYKNYFLGAAAGVAELMAENFKKRFPGLRVSGIYSPPFGEFSDEENRRIINNVNASKPEVLWVSFGCPKQEKWIIDHMDKLNIPIVVGVGAAFDFYSGNLRRAPKIIQKIGLEWFYRFIQEPKRLWSRYFIGGFKFLKIILEQKRKNKIG